MQVLLEMDTRKEWASASELVRKLPDTLRHDLLSNMARDHPQALARILQVSTRTCVRMPAHART